MPSFDLVESTRSRRLHPIDRFEVEQPVVDGLLADLIIRHKIGLVDCNPPRRESQQCGHNT